jgi:hypothetical protein
MAAEWQIPDVVGEITHISVDHEGCEVIVHTGVTDEGNVAHMMVYSAPLLDDYIAALTEARRAIS